MLYHQFSAGDPDVCGSGTDSRSLPDPACVQPMRPPTHAKKCSAIKQLQFLVEFY